MRIIFAGTPDFAAESLKALIAHQHNICAVYTQPDRPAGRGRKLTASPVKQLAELHGILVEQPLNFKDDQARQRLADYQADLMIVVAYGLLLPQAVLDTPKLACINVHASLLPRWRGAAPIQRAILAGDQHTGVCIMKMEAGLDTGPVLLESKCTIEPSDTAQTLHDRLASIGAKALIESLQHIEARLSAVKNQDDTLSCYAKKLSKQEAVIDWQQTADQIVRQVNAFNPWPIAETQWQNDKLRIWQAEVLSDNTSATPGTIIAIDKKGIDISTGDGSLRILQLQKPGKRAMSAQEFLNSSSLSIGDQLG